MSGPRADFIACATALTLQGGGLTLCSRFIRRLDTVMGTGRPMLPDDMLYSAWRAASGVIEARQQADDVAFDVSRHLLRLALAEYWAGRARTSAGHVRGGLRQGSDLSREDIRAVPCPVCGAAPGVRCVYSGKGAVKATRVGRNHYERMQAAQALPTSAPALQVIDPGDRA